MPVNTVLVHSKLKTLYATCLGLDIPIEAQPQTDEIDPECIYGVLT